MDGGTERFMSFSFHCSSGYRISAVRRGERGSENMNKEHRHQEENSNGGWGREWAGGFPSLLPHPTFWKDGVAGVGV